MDNSSMVTNFSTKRSESPGETFKRFFVVVLLGIAFGYIESAVVVYLRTIFHPEGFDFPLHSFGLSDPIFRPLLLAETGRETATVLLVFSGAWLAGRNLRQRFAYFMTIFAVWDIFYYLWLYVLIRWPASIMDWDVLFLIPTTWASPVLYPVLISITMLVFAALILYRDSVGSPIVVSSLGWLGFCLSGLIIVVSLCTAGPYITKPDYASHFYWSLFASGEILAVALFAKVILTRAEHGDE